MSFGYIENSIGRSPIDHEEVDEDFGRSTARPSTNSCPRDANIFLLSGNSCETYFKHISTLVLETQTYFCCSTQTPVKHISNHLTMKLPVFLLVSICSGSDPASQSSATTTTTITSRNLCSWEQFACGDNSCVSLEVISYVPSLYFINYIISPQFPHFAGAMRHRGKLRRQER